MTNEQAKMSLSEILEKTKDSLIISDAFTKADSVLNHKGYKNITCSVSGGADSDILVDICEKVKPHGVHYVWFDTGIEYQATKEHLKYLESHYGITIERERAVKPVIVLIAAQRWTRRLTVDAW